MLQDKALRILKRKKKKKKKIKKKKKKNIKKKKNKKKKFKQRNLNGRKDEIHANNFEPDGQYYAIG